MPHSFGYRARTRDMFAKPFRKQGEPGLSKYLVNYRVGDVVDIKADGSIHRGMPHKFYHGQTGVVFNVTKSSVAVEVMKAVKHRLIKKRINVRIEHISPSRSREDFLRRCKENLEIRKRIKAGEKGLSVKRVPTQPKAGYVMKMSEENRPVTMRAVKFDYNI